MGRFAVDRFAGVWEEAMPLQTDTAKQSIANPMAISMIVKMVMFSGRGKSATV